MRFSANVVQVMIASPSDVATERQVLRTVMADWNDLHAERTRTVVLPLAWESHAVPQMGGRAQEFLNTQVLDSADILVAVFWTRIGSPTGDEPSGTVEEIRRHVKAGRPAMVYFSEAPVRLDSVDDGQYRALREFREECEANGLIETYDSPSDLRDKFFRHLTRTLAEHFGSPADVPSPLPVPAPTAVLSREAQSLLRAAAEDPNGQILVLRVIGGPFIQVRGRRFNEPKDPRSKALWEGAIEELQRLGLVKDRGYKREVFGLTKEGYAAADLLPAEASGGTA